VYLAVDAEFEERPVVPSVRDPLVGAERVEDHLLGEEALGLGELRGTAEEDREGEPDDDEALEEDQGPHGVVPV
jgi:hypothetical protein